MADNEICYYEKSRLEAKMKIEKPHKTSFYKDKKDGFVYCGICEKESFSGNVRYMARLIESKRHYISHPSRLEYSVSKAKPLRHNQTITDEELQEEFKEMEGKYIRIKDLKFLWEEKSGKWPEGFIKINDSDKSTTVISSSYLRRLGKITQLVWTQQRAEGEKGEKLVIFRRTKERWIDPKEKAKRERLEKLNLLNLEEKWENKLDELEADLSTIIVLGNRPEWDPSEDIDYGYYGDAGQKEKENDIAELRARISKVQEGLGHRVTANDENYLDRIKKRFENIIYGDIE